MELELIKNKIFEIRGQKVMLDFDLAVLYQTETISKKTKLVLKNNYVLILSSADWGGILF